VINSISQKSDDGEGGDFYEALRDAQSLRSAAEAVDVTMPKWMGEVMRRSADSIDRMVGEIRLMQIEAEEARGIK
jgi:hypothetical protein